jgi:15,16-dihydrobiliverdin:ferredoxin oxidoreductase
MPMLNIQLELIHKMGMKQVSLDEKFVNCDSQVKPARIGNMCFTSDKFRKVRLTYFDGGENVQVFNTLWYPSYEYDAPLFGVDLISLGPSRILSVMDTQPLYPTPEYSSKYIDSLAPIRNKYPDLHGTLSGKIYDDTSFFSKQMLFGRFTDETKLKPVVLPAFEEYLLEYIKLMDNAKPDNSPEAMTTVKSRQKAYDVYSALKDPAVGLFDAYFGKEWSNEFVHDFLFDLSHKPLLNNNNGVIPSQNVHKFKIDADGHVGMKLQGGKSY